MWFFYFLPMLVAIGFLLARVARGGSLQPAASRARVAIGFVAVAALGILGVLLVRMSH